MNKEKRVLTKGEKNVIKLMAVVTTCVSCLFAWSLYANDYYHADAIAKKAIRGNSEIEIKEKEDYYIFSPKEETKQGIIFYPGGKVDEVAYTPFLLTFAESGYEVYLVKMPVKLAIFGMNAAEDIMEEAAHIEQWTMMGHSLGGAMAASFSAEHDEEVENLVLLAAYSTADLKDKDITVYSFYGTEDKVLNMESYEKYYSNFPDDVIEEIIDGGNHANYAYYGMQDGDGEATITKKEQQECVLDIFLNAK